MDPLCGLANGVGRGVYRPFTHNPQLAGVHQGELQRGNRNRATLAVARKLVAYLMAVDKRGQPFQMPASGEEAA